MELRQLRYVVALAEAGSFTRAAQRLHITQPPLSQQIKLLEEELGAKLFVRSARGVTLTDAGAAFLRHARALSEGVKAALRETSEIASGSIGMVRIGCIGSALFSSMPPILAHLRRTAPSIGLSITELSSQAQTSALLGGELDLGVMHRPWPVPGLQVEPLLRERLRAVVPLRHRLAVRRSIALAVLAEEDFVFASRDVAPVSFDQMIATCVRAGFSPRIRHTASQLATIVQMVRLELGVALVPESLARAPGDGVRFVPVADREAMIDTYLVSARMPKTPAVARVRDAILAVPNAGRRAAASGNAGR